MTGVMTAIATLALAAFVVAGWCAWREERMEREVAR
ncbi:hypothetical protein C7459_102323 [Tumebacillus permanentifrigoris]|uniref:Uncharacterized protein n=1 Tax=Tumebacillus permanentifrigoris TaxID=378543 RepID=A0A316DED4_9BACL|nr:hypothetical protein C7459_102323 [Tumebacillus permanentifrigoris]